MYGLAIKLNHRNFIQSKDVYGLAHFPSKCAQLCNWQRLEDSNYIIENLETIILDSVHSIYFLSDFERIKERLVSLKRVIFTVINFKKGS